MRSADSLAVSQAQALRFFFERLRDVGESAEAPHDEVLYNASVLAHFATTSTASPDFPPSPTDLVAVFDLFVLDTSQHHDAGILEAAGAQCLLLTGFFHDQLKRRHNLDWYAALGAGFYDSAAQRGANATRAAMMGTMAARFAFWRRQQRRLALDLRDEALMLRVN